MSVAFDWLGPQGTNLVKSCGMSGATVIHVGVSVCLFVYLWDGC